MVRNDLVESATYEPDPTAAAAARRFVRDTLQGWVITSDHGDGHGLVDDAVLLTSELVTNAVVHAGTAVQVTCRLVDDGVEVMVCDGHPAGLLPDPPAKGQVPPERTSGRGLLLPNALASAWGVTYSRTAKAVWFRLRLSVPASAARDRPLGGRGAEIGNGPLPGRAGEPGDSRGGRRRTAAAVRLPGSVTAGGYDALLASLVESARAAAAADAACVLMPDEDGDLRLAATAGVMPSPETAVTTVPVAVGGRVVGLLSVMSAVAAGSDSEAAFLQALADCRGPQLEQARVWELERIKRGRMTALTHARRLLTGRLTQREVMALAGETAVPRLVPWCAVLLRDGMSLRAAYVRHTDASLSGALGWILEQAGDLGTSGLVWPPPGAHGGWRWPLAARELAQAPPGARELAGGCAWCFPLGREGEAGVFAVGPERGQHLPRQAAELVADLACRIGIALAGGSLAGQKG